MTLNAEEDGTVGMIEPYRNSLEHILDELHS